MKKLGKLERINLREAWKHEALNFTNWLAEPENLRILSDEIGIEISLIQTEASVGKFNVDILAEEESGNRKIVIENQLESTDHDHLGKIITYASGFDAEIIIWIVKDVRDQHKPAIDWLNDNTKAEVNFFAINIELWKIGDSQLAPKFSTISKPNNWAKALQKSSQNKATDLQMLQLEFWTNFNEFVSSGNATFNIRSPRARHWYDLSLGFGQKAYLTLIIHSRDRYCSVEVYISNSKELFYKLENRKEEIERQSGVEFNWMELPDKQASRIQVRNNNFDLSSSNLWEEYFQWILNSVEKIKPVFTKEIQR